MITTISNPFQILNKPSIKNAKQITVETDNKIPCLKEIITCLIKTSCWLLSFFRKNNIIVKVPIKESVKLMKNRLRPIEVDSYGSRFIITNIQENQLIPEARAIIYNILWWAFPIEFKL